MKGSNFFKNLYMYT